MSYTRQDWARAFLAALGNRAPTQATVDWVVGWSVHETSTGGGATYNLLNTTQKAAGSTQFNQVGVQNFTSFAQGTSINAAVLSQNFTGYSALKQALLNNDIGSLGGPSAGVQQGLKTWCGGCGYGVGFQALGAAHRNDQFPGSTSGTTLPQISTTPTTQPKTITPSATNTGGTLTEPSSSGSSGGTDPLTTLANILKTLAAPIAYVGNFFNTANQWLSNPVRIVKLVVGIGLIGIATFATLGAVSKGIANSRPGKVALGAAETMATGGAATAGKAGKAAAGAAKLAKAAVG